MPEAEYEVVPFEVEYLCDECDEPMKVRAVCPSNNGLRYDHVCKNGHEQRLDARYPQLTYRRYDD